MRVVLFHFAGLLVAAALCLGRAADPDELFAKAVKLHQAGDLKGAIQAYEEYLAVQPEAVEAISNLGAAYARLGEYGKAIPRYRRALELAPENGGVRFNLALALYESGQTPEAIEEFKKVLAAEPDNRRAILLLGDCYFRLADYKNVIALLEPREKAEPENRAILYLLGTALIRDGQASRGMVLMDRLLRNGDTPEAHLMLGIGRMMSLDHPGALNEFRRALELNPKIATAHSLAGQCLLVLNKNDEAIEEFRRELELNPNDFDSHLQLGSLLRKDGRLKDAAAHLDRAAQIRPGSPDVRYQVASVKLADGKTSEAQAELEQLVKEYPNFNEAHISLATIYYRAGRKADGDREREIVRRLEAEMKKPIAEAARAPSRDPGSSKPTATAPAAKPEPAGARANERETFEQLVARAAGARESERIAEAVDLYRRALRQKPDWAEGWWYLGTLHYGEDRYKEGYDAFAELVTLKPKKGVAWAMLGLCEFQLKDYEKALVHLQHGRLLGLAENLQLTRVTRYHVAILLTRFNEPESAMKILDYLALEDEREHHAPSEAVVTAMGLSGLQMPLLPGEVPEDKKELVNKVGQAQYANSVREPAKASALLQEMVSRYGNLPGVHYCYGAYLFSQNPEKALEEFKQEIRVSPGHYKARLQIALEHIKRGEFEAALPYAEETLKLVPQMFISHSVMGQALLGLDRIEPAVKELETAVKLAPDSPETRYTLARAYAAAGRKQDAARERAEFTRLDKVRREREKPRAPAQDRSQNVGAAEQPTTTGQRP